MLNRLRRSSNPETGRFGSELDVAYNVPFNWGSLLVTQEANQAYELKPLNTDLENGRPESIAGPTSDGMPKVAVWLIGPTEAPWSITGRDTHAFAMGATNNISREVVDSVVGFHNNRQTTRQRILDVYENINESLSSELGVQVPESPDDETIETFIDNNYVHHLPIAAHEIVKRGVGDWLDESFNRIMLRGIKKEAQATLLLAGATIAFTDGISAELPGLLAAGGYTTFKMSEIFRVLQKSMVLKRQTKDMTDAAAGLIAATAGLDLHRSYCTNDLDEVARQFRGQTDEEDLDEDD